MMTTICEIIDVDGQVWSIEDDCGAYLLMHTSDMDAPGPPTSIPVTLEILERAAAAIRGRSVVTDHRQSVIPFRKFIPSNPRSGTIAF